jgi:pSer/pThr/pTyr-binding forkhead associated (FHA) protein
VVFTGLHVPQIEASITEVKSDGTTGATTEITKEIFIGSGDCDLRYPADALLAPRHAALAVKEAKLLLKDLGSPNGTFIKQRQDSELKAGDVFLLGRTLFRFTIQSMDEAANNLGPVQGTIVLKAPPKLQKGPVTAKLEQIQLTGEVIQEFSLDNPETTLGRVSGDLVFGQDPYMSGTHARILAQPGRFLLQDLKSRNGVYRRIRDQVELADGDEFFLGEQLFRVSLKIT